MSHRRVDGRGRMVKSMAIDSYRDETMGREGGLQVRAYKEVPRASRRLALAQVGYNS
jgi:hypothetical protein